MPPTICYVPQSNERKECMERGISLVPLVVTGVSTGLYGRACVTVGDPKGRPLPAHRLGPGDQVRLYSSKGSSKGVAGDERASEISGAAGCVFRHIALLFLLLILPYRYYSQAVHKQNHVLITFLGWFLWQTLFC